MSASLIDNCVNMMAFAVLMMILSQSSAFLISPIRHISIRHRVLQKVEGFLSSKDNNKVITSSSIYVYTSRSETTTDHEQNSQTALLWLSTNRLRIKDNLALCKAAVEAHGGAISAESIDGKGVRFRFVL